MIRVRLGEWEGLGWARRIMNGSWMISGVNCEVGALVHEKTHMQEEFSPFSLNCTAVVSWLISSGVSMIPLREKARLHDDVARCYVS